MLSTCPHFWSVPPNRHSILYSIYERSEILYNLLLHALGVIILLKPTPVTDRVLRQSSRVFNCRDPCLRGEPLMSSTNTMKRKDARIYAAVAHDEEASTTTSADPLEKGTLVLRRERTWTDTYFEDKIDSSDLVAVFDTSDELANSVACCLCRTFVTVSWLLVLFLLMAVSFPDYEYRGIDAFLLPFLFLCTAPGIVFFWTGNRNRKERTLSYGHIAVTNQGIRVDLNLNQKAFPMSRFVSAYDLICRRYRISKCFFFELIHQYMFIVL